MIVAMLLYISAHTGALLAPPMVINGLAAASVATSCRVQLVSEGFFVYKKLDCL